MIQNSFGSVLITNHHLVDFGGSELNAYTLAKYFKDNGSNVVVGTFQYKQPMQELFLQAGIQVVNMLEDEFPTKQFDLAWAHHAPTLYSCIFDHGLQFKQVIFGSLSPCEPLEALPVFANKITCVLANSNETKDKLIQEMPGLNNLHVFPNYAMEEFFSLTYKTRLVLKRIAIISNHIPPELLEFKEYMKCIHDVTVELIGLQFKARFVDAVLLGDYDLIIAIGKTVQYAMAARVPIYCYDHFGGPGWLDASNINLAEYFNFSGRGFNRKLSVEELVADILDEGYKNNLSNLDFLRSYAVSKFSFASNIASLLDWLSRQPLIDGEVFSHYGYLQRQNKYYTNLYTRSSQTMIISSQAVAERDGQISALREQEVQLQEQVRDLVSSAQESGMQIASLSQAVAERDGQIGALREQEVQLQEQVRDLVSSAQESGMQIASLSQAVAERDGQISALREQEVQLQEQVRDLVSSAQESGMQIASLSQAVAERDGQIGAILSSRSWRLTRPMRWLGDAFKDMVGESQSIYCRLRRRIRIMLEHLPGGFLIVEALMTVRRYRASLREQASADIPLALAALAEVRSQTLSADWYRRIVSAGKVCFEERNLPYITISVVLYNSQKWLKPFVRALLESDYSLNKVSLIFVDNGSIDETVEHVNVLIAEHGNCFQRIELIKCLNVGYGSSNHKAILKSEDDFILVTNVDTEFDRTMLRILVQTAVSDAPDVACWEPMQVPHEHPKYYDPVTLLTNWCSHACVLVRRSAYLACGGYDKRIFMYGEDVELSFRLRSHGNKLRYVPNARILHHVDLDDSQMASSKLILQISGSLAANVLLRYRYGRWRDMFVGEFMLRGLKRKTISDESRNQAVRKAICIVNRHRIHYARTHHRGDAFFPFKGFDFDLTRDGAFHRRKLECSTPDLPRVSIITRTMKHRWWILSEAIASVINQTYPNIEHIIVEDGSSELQLKINQCRYLQDIRHLQSTRGGRSAAGNVGLEAASGEFVMFLDDDDLLFPDHVETLVERLQETSEAISAYSLAWTVQTDIEWQAERYSEVLHEVLPEHKLPFSHEKVLVSNLASIQAVLFRRSAYEIAGGFHEDISALEDWNLWCRFAMLGNFVLVEKLTSLYRVPAKKNVSTERQKVLTTAYESVRKRNFADREILLRRFDLNEIQRLSSLRVRDGIATASGKSG